VRPLPRLLEIPRLSDNTYLEWPGWRRFIANSGQRYVYNDRFNRPCVLKSAERGGQSSRNYCNKSFRDQEDLVLFLRRNARELLREAYRLQRDTAFALELCAIEGHVVVPGTIDLRDCDHRGAQAAALAHDEAATRRYRYLWPEDLAEAARLWRDEARGVFPPAFTDRFDEWLARARAATLQAATDAAGVPVPSPRARL
jgi:hypothetical protein